MAQPDPLRALVAYLRASPGVSALAAARVFADELPGSENSTMPRAAVVVSSGGGGLMGNAQKYGDRRVDVRCYAKSPAAARALHNEVRAALKNLMRVVVNDTATTSVLLHWARVSSDGTAARDLNTDWPVYLSSWQVLASDIKA